MVKQLSKEEITTIKIMREQGYSARGIAQKLGRSDKTIKNWFKKLGLPTNLKVAGIEKKTALYPIVCKTCGERYDATRYNAKFCSDICRHSYNRKNRGVKQVCDYCNSEYKGYKLTTHCTVECKRKDFNSKRSIIINRSKCCGCGVVMIGGRRRDYCSKQCNRRHHYENNRINYVSQVRTHSIKCVECGKHKEVTYKRKKYCTDECKRKYQWRRKDAKRRFAIRTNGKVDWDISIERLIKRDGMKCYLCGDDVIKHDNTNHELYPSIEHVMPVAKGGTHTWDNVRLAHRKCNWEKSDKIITQGHTPGQRKALS